jgi:WD40 repeat protein
MVDMKIKHSQRKSTMHTSDKLNLILIVTAFACLCGCGDDSTAKPVATSNSSPSAVSIGASDAAQTSDAKPAVEPQQNSGSPEISQSVKMPDTKAEVAEAVPTQNNVPVQNNVPAEAQKTPSRQVAKPTPEQIALWTVVESDPLQLLACRDSSPIGLVRTIEPLADGRHYLLAGTKITLWSVESDSPEHVFFESAGENAIESLAVSADGTWFVAGDKEGNLRSWSISDRKELKTAKAYSTGVIQTAISPDAKKIATLTYDDEITIWNADDLQQQSRFKVDTNGLKRIEFMTSELLAAAGETTSAWNVSTGKLDRELSSDRYNFVLGRSKDGSRFVFGKDESLQLWNIADNKPETTFNGGFAQDELVAFSTDGSMMATANQSSIRIWDLASGRLIQFVDAFGWPTVGLSWLPETDLLLVSSMTGRTRIWGTAKNGEKLSMRPLHESISLPDPASREPATPPQLVQSIDLRTFPRLPDGKVIVSDQFMLMYEVERCCQRCANVLSVSTGKGRVDGRRCGPGNAGLFEIHEAQASRLAMSILCERRSEDSSEREPRWQLRPALAAEV